MDVDELLRLSEQRLEALIEGITSNGIDETSILAQELQRLSFGKDEMRTVLIASQEEEDEGLLEFESTLRAQSLPASPKSVPTTASASEPPLPPPPSSLPSHAEALDSDDVTQPVTQAPTAISPTEVSVRPLLEVQQALHAKSKEVERLLAEAEGRFAAVEECIRWKETTTQYASILIQSVRRILQMPPEEISVHDREVTNRLCDTLSAQLEKPVEIPDDVRMVMDRHKTLKSIYFHPKSISSAASSPAKSSAAFTTSLSARHEALAEIDEGEEEDEEDELDPECDENSRGGGGAKEAKLEDQRLSPGWQSASPTMRTDSGSTGTNAAATPSLSETAKQKMVAKEHSSARGSSITAYSRSGAATAPNGTGSGTGTSTGTGTGIGPQAPHRKHSIYSAGGGMRTVPTRQVAARTRRSTLASAGVLLESAAGPPPAFAFLSSTEERGCASLFHLCTIIQNELTSDGSPTQSRSSNTNGALSALSPSNSSSPSSAVRLSSDLASTEELMDSVHGQWVGRKAFLTMCYALNIFDESATLEQVLRAFERAVMTSIRGKKKFSARLSYNDFVSTVCVIADFKYLSQRERGSNVAAGAAESGAERLSRLLKSVSSEVAELRRNAALRSFMVSCFAPCTVDAVYLKLAFHQDVLFAAFKRSKSFGKLNVKRGHHHVTAFEAFCENCSIVPKIATKPLVKRIAQYVLSHRIDKEEGLRSFFCCTAYLALALTVQVGARPIRNQHTTGSSQQEQGARTANSDSAAAAVAKDSALFAEMVDRIVNLVDAASIGVRST